MVSGGTLRLWVGWGRGRKIPAVGIPADFLKEAASQTGKGDGGSGKRQGRGRCVAQHGEGVVLARGCSCCSEVVCPLPCEELHWLLVAEAPNAPCGENLLMEMKRLGRGCPVGGCPQQLSPWSGGAPISCTDASSSPALAPAAALGCQTGLAHSGFHLPGPRAFGLAWPGLVLPWDGL